MNEETKPFRVLSIDGGGMRGLYTATYLSALAKQAAAQRNAGDLDIGKAFDLIVGTSTGGIIACALVAGISLDSVADLYREHGASIFPKKMPSAFNLDLLCQLKTRPRLLAQGTKALECALVDTLGEETVKDVYNRRNIALAVAAVEMSRHRSWVFKTSHLGGHRDDGFRLADVCLATSAAPLFRSMARIESPLSPGTFHVFVDGGLWANNPILVGLIDALAMTKPHRGIELFSLGNCPRPAGDIIRDDEVHRGLSQWKFGGEAAVISLDAQDYAYHQMAKMLAMHVDRDCKIVRFPQGEVSASAMPYMDLDETTPHGLEVMSQQAIDDVSLTLSDCRHEASEEAKILARLLREIPEFEQIK